MVRVLLVIWTAFELDTCKIFMDWGYFVWGWIVAVGGLTN